SHGVPPPPVGGCLPEAPRPVPALHGTLPRTCVQARVLAAPAAPSTESAALVRRAVRGGAASGWRGALACGVVRGGSRSRPSAPLGVAFARADDGTRTRDPHLGKVSQTVAPPASMGSSGQLPSRNGVGRRLLVLVCFGLLADYPRTTNGAKDEDSPALLRGQTVAVRFHSAWAKLERAKFHLDTLQTEFVNWGRQQGNGGHPPFIKEFNAQQSYFTFRVSPEQIPPAELGLILGDFLTNARAALDHVAWELVKTGSNPSPDRAHLVQFPICVTSDSDFDGRRSTQLPGVGDEVVAIIRRYQPYIRGQFTDTHP